MVGRRDEELGKSLYSVQIKGMKGCFFETQGEQDRVRLRLLSIYHEIFLATQQLMRILSRQIFCVHGGIPLPSQGGGLLSSIDSIPSVLFEPENQSELAWELMWGDPLR